MATPSDKPYTLHKSRNVLLWANTWYKRHGKTLSHEQLSVVESDLQQLDQAVLRGDKEVADRVAHKIEGYGKPLFKKSTFEYIYELAFALILAIVIATLIRQMWFEPFEIPTGSMRPTFEEQDHLTVTKTAFGINTPLMTSHLYFDPSLVQRTGIVIFSGDNIPLPDTDSTYLWVIPYKKRYIKRLIGKPGDILYFYGGKIYGIDKKGNPIRELIDNPWIEKIEHIPFLTFQGNLSSQQNNINFHLMSSSIGRLTFLRQGEAKGEIFNGHEWIKDDPLAQKRPHQTIQAYSDIWGIRNYAMARLLTKTELEEFTNADVSQLPDAPLYLELRHHPSLTYPKPTLPTAQNGFRVLLNALTSVIPLQQQHIDAIMDNMYTARFDINDGRARKYSAGGDHVGTTTPNFPEVPDGRYEFYYGKGYSIGWGAIQHALPSENLLYSHQPQNVQKLYNLGIDLETEFAPYSLDQTYFPHRYAYFRDGDLYLLGAPIFKKDDPVLNDFVKAEQAKEQASTATRPYIAFKDYGPPLKDGQFDVEFIRSSLG